MFTNNFKWENSMIYDTARDVWTEEKKNGIGGTVCSKKKKAEWYGGKKFWKDLDKIFCSISFHIRHEFRW